MARVTMFFDLGSVYNPKTPGDYQSLADETISDLLGEGLNISERVLDEMKKYSTANQYGIALTFNMDRDNYDLRNNDDSSHSLYQLAEDTAYFLTGMGFEYRLIMRIEDEHQESIFSFDFEDSTYYEKIILKQNRNPCTIFYESGTEPVKDDMFCYSNGVSIDEKEFESKEDWKRPAWIALAKAWGYSDVPGVEMV